MKYIFLLLLLGTYSNSQAMDISRPQNIHRDPLEQEEASLRSQLANLQQQQADAKQELAQSLVSIETKYAYKKAGAFLIAAGFVAAKTSYDVYKFYTNGDVPLTNLTLDGLWLGGTLTGSVYQLMRSCYKKQKGE